MNISNYLESAILNAVFRNTPYSSPAKVYVALYTSDPTENDTGTEVSGHAYERLEVTFSAPVQGANAATIENASELGFPVASGEWGTISHVGIRDAAEAGNLLYYGSLDTPRTIQENDRLKFLAGELKIGLG